MKYHNYENNGEIQPLMVNLDQMSDEQEALDSLRRQRKRQKKKFKIFCFAGTGVVVSLALLVFILVIMGKEAEKKRQQIASHSSDKKADEAYSKKADDNLQTIFNSQVPTNTPVGCQSTVLIMPSCESKNDKDKCNIVGLERSFYLITLFGRERRWPVPWDIFVLGSSYKRQRAVETMLPLQNYYHVQNRSEPTGYSQRKELVRDIASLITNGTLCGNIVTVTTVYGHEIPMLASDLGCGPLNAGAGCPAVFAQDDNDSVWELRFVYDKQGDQGLDDDDDDDDHNHAIQDGQIGNMSNIEESVHRDTLRWRVFGSVVREKFDPLAFSKIVGDYNRSNTEIKIDPRWMNMTVYDHLP